jgi:cleavage stimulation factor subunit 1
MYSSGSPPRKECFPTNALACVNPPPPPPTRTHTHHPYMAQPCAPSERLSLITELGVQSEGRQKALLESETGAVGGIARAAPVGLDFDAAEPREATTAGALVPVEAYRTKHRGEVRAVCFSADGSFAASADKAALVKIYSVQKVLAISAGGAGAGEGSPVIRTIADQRRPINDISFHPEASVLVCASDDCTISFYNFQQPNPIRPLRTIQESHPVNSFALHPKGNFMVAGTDHPILRLYDVNTAQCFAAQNALDHHTAPVSVVR